MTSFSLSTKIFCFLTAPANRKKLIRVNKFGEKTKFNKLKHTLCHGLSGEFFLRGIQFSAYLGLSTRL